MILSRIASFGTPDHRPFLRTISTGRFHGFSSVLKCGVNSWNEGRRRTAGSMKRATLLRAVAADQQRISLAEEIPAKSKEAFWEEQIEKSIYMFRFFTFLGVAGSLIGSMLCFFKGCVLVATCFMQYFATRGKVISMLIHAIDVYLIGTVMLVFGMGLYELFISNLDITTSSSSSRSNIPGFFTLKERPKWLEIKSVNELKTKVGHVIVMALLVGIFEKSNNIVVFSTPIDLLCFAASIMFSSCGLYILSKLKH